MTTMRAACLAILLMATAPGPSESADPMVRVGQAAPEITGGPWINSEALSMEKLRGRVVFVEFWTFG